MSSPVPLEDLPYHGTPLAELGVASAQFYLQ